MKILHVGNHTIPCVGGIESVIWQAARAQARMGHAVSIMVFNTCTKPGTKLDSREEKDGVSIHRVSQRGPAFYRMPPVRALLSAARDADVVHVHGLGAWVDMLCVLKPIHGTKIVVNTHGGFGHTPARGGFKRVYARVLHPLFKQGVDFFFLDAEEDKTYIGKWPARKYAVIPDGVETRTLTKLSLAKKNKNHFLFVGRLSRNKRVDRLLEAFARVVKKAPKAYLSIAGEDWEGLRNQHAQLIRSLGLEKNVELLGKISDAELHRLYTKAGVFVSASEYEGFGLSVIEAMAAGCVPVLNDIPTFRTFGGNNRGIIVDFSDAEKAGDALLAMTKTPAAKWKQWQARVRAYSQRYSIDVIEKAHVNVYEKILQGAGQD